MDSKQITQTRLLGFAGLIPFLLCVPGFYLFDDPFQSFFQTTFIAYSAVILSFIGAVHWGAVLKSETIEQANLLLGIGVLPSLIGWVALLLPPLFALIILSFAFPTLFIYEKFSSLSDHLPDWYFKMRIQLTMIVTLLHFVMLGGNLQ